MQWEWGVIKEPGNVTNSLAGLPRLREDHPVNRILPILGSAAASTRIEAPSTLGPGSALPVLLVGCDSADHLYLRTRLSLRRLEVRSVADAAAAVEHCAEHVVAMVFVDGDVVGAAAMTLCRQLASPHACRRTPSVVLMGGGDRGIGWRWRATRHRCRWLPKPLHPRDLDLAIRRGLDGLVDPASEREIVSLFQ